MKLTSLLLCCCFVFTAVSQNVIDSRQREIVFNNVNVVPMDRNRIIENRTVVISGGFIKSIGAANTIKAGNDALVIDATGKYLIPGLAEMHAHVPPVDDLDPMKEVLLLYTMNGITTIRGMLGHPKHLELRSKIQNGEILGPRFYTSGPSFNGNSVTSPEKGEAMVREQKKAGYDFLKLHPGLTVEKFNAIAETAKEVNIPFAGHVSYAVGIRRAIDAGYASIDHLDGFVERLVPGIENISEQDEGIFGIFLIDKVDTSRIPELMAALRDHHISVVPTQALAERWFAPGKTAEDLNNAPEMIYIDEQTRQNWVNSKKSLQSNPKYDAEAVDRFIQLRRQLILACQRNGVSLLLGSDAPQVFNVPGFSLHHELQYMVEAGLTPYEALRSGTANVATYFNLSSEAGTIEQGKVADLVLLQGNPLNDISQTTKIEGVILNGKWLSKEYIQATLKTLEKD